jgi:hypothetical protein
VIDCYWTVLDLVAPNDPSEVLPGRIIELGVQESCDLRFLDLLLHEACLILGDSINKNKLAGCLWDQNNVVRSRASEIPCPAFILARDAPQTFGRCCHT